MLRRFARPVVTARAEDPVRVVAEKMRIHGVGAIVIVDRRRPIGIVTDRDLAIRVLADAREPARTSAGEVMTEAPVTASVDAGIEPALAAMRISGVRRLPLVDEQGAIVGIVTYDDLVVLLSRELAELGTGIEGNVDAPELR